jgi:hypothetical protein
MWHGVVGCVIPYVLKGQTVLFISISSHSSWTAWPWRWRHHEPIKMLQNIPSNTALHSRRIFCNTAVRNSDLFLACCIWISLNLIFWDVSSHPVGAHFCCSGNTTVFCDWVQYTVGHTVAQLVEALPYKPEGCGFDSWWCHWNFSLTCSFQPHYGPVVDSASNRNEYQFPGAWRWPVCWADKLTTFMCRLSWNLGASTSRNPQGLSRPVMGLL